LREIFDVKQENFVIESPNRVVVCFTVSHFPNIFVLLERLQKCTWQHCQVACLLSERVSETRRMFACSLARFLLLALHGCQRVKLKKTSRLSAAFDYCSVQRAAWKEPSC